MSYGPRIRAARWAAVIALLASVACGDDGGSASPDASVADAGPCGADLYYQAEILDWSTGLSVPNSAMPAPTVTMTEVGNETNTTPVAPNGRAVLCLPADSVSQVRVESSAHLPHIEVVDPSVYPSMLMTDQLFADRIYLLKQEDLDALAAGDGATDKGHVLVNVSGEALTIDVALGANSDEGLVGVPGAAFSPGSSVVASSDDRVVFRNVDTGSSTLSLSGGLCSSLDSIPVVAGTTTGVIAACFLGP